MLRFAHKLNLYIEETYYLDIHISTSYCIILLCNIYHIYRSVLLYSSVFYSTRLASLNWSAFIAFIIEFVGYRLILSNRTIRMYCSKRIILKYLSRALIHQGEMLCTLEHNTSIIGEHNRWKFQEILKGILCEALKPLLHLIKTYTC